MQLSLDSSVTAPRHITAESLVLEWWYDSQPTVRRLWGIKDSQRLRVVIELEPTHDDDDNYAIWFAKADAWASELHMHTGSPVQLELIQELPRDGNDINAGGIIIAEMFWRDATLN